MTEGVGWVKSFVFPTDMNTTNKKPTLAEIIEAIKAAGKTEQYKAKYAKFLPNGHVAQINGPRCAR